MEDLKEPLVQRTIAFMRDTFARSIPIFECCGLVAVGTLAAEQERFVFLSQVRSEIWTGPQTEGQRVLKVLIVEDDLMMADFMEELLVDHGYEVSGIARTVEAAIALAQHSKPNLVILDMRLADGGLGTEVAAQLYPPGRPGILYATGNMSQVALTSADGDACLAKPYRSADLLRSLEIVAGIVATGRAQPPFPRGFQLLHPAAVKSQAVGL
jgi:CheY-like chemotaxis protein